MNDPRLPLWWVRVDAATGAVDADEVDVAWSELMRRFHLSGRDRRFFDPVTSQDGNLCTIRGRERAILFILGPLRCIIAADQALALRAGDGVLVQAYAAELKRRLVFKDSVAALRGLPLEFIAVEIALEDATSFLDSEAASLEIEFYPLMDRLITKVTLDDLNSLKTRKQELNLLLRRVEKVRDEIERLVEDDGGMAEMCLTERQEAEGASVNIGRAGPSPSAPVLPPPASRSLDSFKSLDSKDVVRSSKEELEKMLGTYFVLIGVTQSKLNTLKDHIDVAEALINLSLDNVRNQLIKFELMMNTATFVTSIMGVVLGIFGMNFDEAVFKVPRAFEWTLSVTVASGLVIFCFLIWYLRKKVFPL